MAKRWVEYALKWMGVTFIVGFVVGIVFSNHLLIAAFIVWTFSGLYLFKQIDGYVEGKMRRKIARQ